MSQVECRLSLGFDAIEFALTGRNQGLTPTLSRIAFQAGNVEAAAQALESAAKQLTAVGNLKRVDVRVAGRWLHWLNLPWSAALLSRASTQEACRLQMQLNHGAIVPLAFALGAAPYGMERVAVGLPEALLTALCSLADRADLSVVPAAMAALAVVPEASSRHYSLFVCEAGVLTCLLVRNGALCRAYSQALPSDGLVGLSAVWQRLRLRDEALAACERVYVLDLAAKNESVQSALPLPLQYLPFIDPVMGRSSSAKTALNFLPHLQPWRGWRGAAAAIGLLLMIATGWYWWGAQQALNQAQQRLAAVSVNAAERRAMPVTVTAKNSLDLQVQIKGVNEAVRQLSAPVGRILQSLKPAPASGIALLQLHFKAGQARQLSIEGIAPKAEAMTAYVTALGAKPVFASAWLAHHELVGEDLSGGYRFTIEASWQE